MSETIISVENVSKKYVIGHQSSSREGLRHRIEHLARAPWRLVRAAFRSAEGGGTAAVGGAQLAGPKSVRVSQPAREDLWALRDISFQVAQGDLVGIIGRNGAGKSTLLKILSRITEPTSGRIRMRGRVSSLLEVGTGFHHELTGRENIYLNGAILGMSKAEITSKFDEIVAFSEIERFLDTPVKRYSSGMYVRLAFAVAAHMEPEVLIVDEVLAVGDAAFQKKCIGKMSDVATTGRTILFVSHDISSVTKLCRRGILLNAGQIEAQGEIADVVGKYLSANIVEGGYADLSIRDDHSGSGEGRFQSIELLHDGRRNSTFAFAESLTFRIKIRVNESFGNGHVAITILTNDGIAVHCFQNLYEGVDWPTTVGVHTMEVTVPMLRIVPGNYVVDLWLGDPQTYRVDLVKQALGFNVIQTGSGGIVHPLKRVDGLVAETSTWTIIG